MPDVTGTGLSIIKLPELILDMFQRTRPDAVPGKQLFVRYLRRKAGRGLAVIYETDAGSNRRTLSLTLDEQALDGPYIRFTRQQATAATIELLPSGVLHSAELGLTIQLFPIDEGLPTLASCLDTDSEGPIFASLQRAARQRLHDSSYHLHTAKAVPVRYKPGNRCVIRYDLRVSPPHDDEPVSGHHERPLTLFGKVYAKAEQAQAVFHTTQQLYNEQAYRRENSLRHSTPDAPLLPQPFMLVEETNLILNEAVQAPAKASKNDALLTGNRMFQPQFKRGRGGEIIDLSVPETALRLTAIALARIHTSQSRPAEQTPRTGKKEAKRARERAGLIAAYYPTLAEQTLGSVDQLAARLEEQPPVIYRPAHGGFKASQLLFHSGKVFVVDFDGFCLADPALDVGYFLAYLRPSGLWYKKTGMRDWFQAASTIFKESYQQAMQARGISQEALEGILQRTRLYEAALIFKIATRRVNRLNSPRLPELTAMLTEIQDCLNT